MSESGEMGHHKKTIYEEAIFNVESERYEFDINIEANLHTIAMLEDVTAQIQGLCAEERAKFKLPPDLVRTYLKIVHSRISSRFTNISIYSWRLEKHLSENN